MSKEARFLLVALGFGVSLMLVLALIRYTPVASLDWISSSLKDAVSPLYDSIQSHPDGWFRWTMIVFLVMIFNRLGKIIYLLSQVAFGTNWRYRNTIRRNNRYAKMSTASRRRAYDPRWANLRPGLATAIANGRSPYPQAGRTDMKH